MHTYEHTTVNYHSAAWSELVEIGWFTAFVSNGWAYMMREIR